MHCTVSDGESVSFSSQKTVRKLVERGLVVERPVQVLRATVTAYDVPIAVHAAWCEHCSKQHGVAP